MIFTSPPPVADIAAAAAAAGLGRGGWRRALSLGGAGVLLGGAVSAGAMFALPADLDVRHMDCPPVVQAAPQTSVAPATDTQPGYTGQPTPSDPQAPQATAPVAPAAATSTTATVTTPATTTPAPAAAATPAATTAKPTAAERKRLAERRAKQRAAAARAKARREARAAKLREQRRVQRLLAGAPWSLSDAAGDAPGSGMDIRSVASRQSGSGASIRVNLAAATSGRAVTLNLTAQNAQPVTLEAVRLQSGHFQLRKSGVVVPGGRATNMLTAIDIYVPASAIPGRGRAVAVASSHGDHTAAFRVR